MIPQSASLSAHFQPFREHIIGQYQQFESPFGSQRILYADWTASGRAYLPIEQRLQTEILPYVANTHTETSYTGAMMTEAYHHALSLIKRHVNANQHDVIISFGAGMTAVVNKLQRILGLRLHEKFSNRVQIPEQERPIVFISHMEHHSNQTSWLETIAQVEIIPADGQGLLDLSQLELLLEKYQARPLKIAAITSCSNVTGIFTPYYEVAERMHKAGGYCFVDFACSAPYIDIDMHPANPLQRLDAVYFSPHKFLGGVGATGILVFNSVLYDNRIPDSVGGGTVEWTNPWGEHQYIADIQAREDGGTPAFLQTMRAAMAMCLQKQLQTELIHQQERILLQILTDRLSQLPNLHILAPQQLDRLAIVSFYIDNLHYNLAVRLLNDRFGIQTRGGCSCAGTYGHYLLNVDVEKSHQITSQIGKGILNNKPGWVRVSLHPTMSYEEVGFIADAIAAVCENFPAWAAGYEYIPHRNDFIYKGYQPQKLYQSWFKP